MSKAVPHVHDVELTHEQASPKPDEIRRQLSRILESPSFHGSKRCQQFLEYVCEKSLVAESGMLKERTIAIEVFGRRPQSDMGDDTIVRVGAREVRKRLAQYYVTTEGAASEVRIDLPSGSYAPEFRYVSPQKEESHPAGLTPDPPRGRRWGLGLIFASVVMLLAVVALLTMKWTSASPNAAAFHRFWEPVFRSPEPLLLAMAHPIVYHASARAFRISEESQPPNDAPAQRPIQVPPGKLDGSDLIPVLNQYVGFGDMVVATEISTMLARQSKSVRVRLASNVAFADLRRAQTLLIGAVTNRWTTEFQQAWRFQFRKVPGPKTVIKDTLENRQWSIPSREDGSAPEDYILICRIRTSVTGGLLMVGAGLKQFGTEAAGRLLADPEQLGVILHKLPAGWESKNLQIVLHARVIGNTPAQPEVVAWHVW